MVRDGTKTKHHQEQEQEQEQPHDELWASLPRGKIAEVDKARGPYFTRSKFVLYALDRAIQEVNSGTLRIEKGERNTPLGASVRDEAPNSLDSSLNNNTPPAEEAVAGVS